MGLAAASVILLAVASLTPRSYVAVPIGLACGIAGGVVALVAIFRHGERAITVFAALVPWLLALVFLLAELIVGHDWEHS